MRRARRGRFAAAAIAAAALLGCGAEAAPEGAESLRPDGLQSPPRAPPEGTRGSAQGAQGPCAGEGDPALAIHLCPAADHGAAALRAALLAVDSPTAALRLRPHLAGAPDLEGLARLVLLDRPAAPASSLASPVDAVVSPIDDAVLAQVALAMRLRHAAEASHADRMRALALLARVHNEALLQLGLGEGEPLGPLARLLAGRFLHCARELIQGTTQRRVAGLEALVPAIELRLFAVSEALAQSPHAGDDALLAVERQRARRYLLRGATRRRMEAATGRDPAASLGPWPGEIERLLDQQFVDLAIERALAEAGAHGSDAALDRLLGALDRRGRDDGRRLAIDRFAQAEAGEAPPPRQGAAPVPPDAPPAFTAAGAIADAIAGRLAGSGDGAPRRAAVAAALLELRGRPDATDALLARILPEGEGSTEAGLSALVADLAWIVAELEAALVPADTRLRRQVAAARVRPEADGDAAEAALRRRFALAARAAQRAADARIVDEALLARASAADQAALLAAAAEPGEAAPDPADEP